MFLSSDTSCFWFCSRCFRVVSLVSSYESPPVCLKCGSSLFVEVEC